MVYARVQGWMAQAQEPHRSHRFPIGSDEKRSRWGSSVQTRTPPNAGYAWYNQHCAKHNWRRYVIALQLALFSNCDQPTLESDQPNHPNHSNDHVQQSRFTSYNLGTDRTMTTDSCRVLCRLLALLSW